MPSETLIIEALRSLGMPGILAALLFYLLRQANQERLDVTRRFLDSLDRRADEDRAADAQIATALQLYQQQATAEHHALLEVAKDLMVAIKELREEMRK